jgi:hypothetical protein
MKKISLRDFEERKRYDRILQQLKYKTRSSPPREEIPVMKKSRVLKKFFIKVLTSIVLPVIAFMAIFAVAVGFTVALTYFGVPQDLAKLIGPATTILVPFLFYILRGLYKEAISEVARENKKLMNDLRGDR